MRRAPLLAVPAVVALSLTAVPVSQALAAGEGAAAEIVVDVPPDFVRYGSEVALSGTVFAADGRRAVKNPVALATWDANLEEFVWGKTVVTDANGRFRTSVRADATTGQAALLAPLLDRGDGAQLVQADVPAVKLQYPVSITVKNTTGTITVTGATPDCDGATQLDVEWAARGAYQLLGTTSCTPAEDKFTLQAPRPTAPVGLVQYRVRRAADDLSVASTSNVVSVR